MRLSEEGIITFLEVHLGLELAKGFRVVMGVGEVFLEVVRV